jgi:hypothetical protein
MPARPRPRDLAWLVLLCLAGVAAVLSSRGPRPRASFEAPTPAQVSMDALSPEPPPRAPVPRPPQAREAQQAMRRVFADALDADARRAVAGDFNGDGAEDIAVVARPSRGALGRVNHELANWTVQDAQAPPLDPGRPPAPRPTLADGDVVLAVIHGYGAEGWRSAEARQAYLVRNAAGDGLAVRALGDAARDLSGTARARLRGDVIAGSLRGRPGFLYWSGARYVWAARNAASAAR